MLLLGCAGAETSVRVDLTSNVELSAIVFTAEIDDPSEPARSLEAPFVQSARLRLPPAWDGQVLRLGAIGFLNGERVAFGETTVTVRRNEEVRTSIALRPLACGDGCEENDVRCVGDGVSVCQRRTSDGCLAWDRPTACGGATPFCSLGGCRADCVDECGLGERRCTGPGAFERCDDIDSDPCLEWGPATVCDLGAFCSGGACAVGSACGANERVLAGECVRCDAGETNEPGDNPAGPDTMCDSDVPGEDPCLPVVGVSCDEFDEAYIKAANAEEFDTFGFSVALDGDTLVVGAPFEDGGSPGVDGDDADNGVDNAGAAYVFVRSGTAWIQQAYLKAGAPRAQREFGYSVAIEGDTIAVGARFEDGGATGVNGEEMSFGPRNAGAVYVYRRSGTTWSREAYLKAGDPDVDDNFGSALAISGDRLAVGAPREDSADTGVGGDENNIFASDSGAVYLFHREGSEWFFEAFVKASNTDRNDAFGGAVALEGSTLAVGAQGEASASALDQEDDSRGLAGAVYVYTLDGAQWSQQAYLKASMPGGVDRFGFALALSGDTLAVSAPAEDSNARGIDGDETNDAARDAGAVYVFTRSGTVWTQQAYIKASNTERSGTAEEKFGWHLDLQGDTLVVGAPDENGGGVGLGADPLDNSAPGSGAVYVFMRSGGTWSETAYIKPPVAETGARDPDNFGQAVALSGGTLVIGMPNDDSSSAGVDGDVNDNSARDSGAVFVRRLTR
ncbi:MAG: FG-GAP repeat protein [Myxococcota bacterium]